MKHKGLGMNTRNELIGAECQAYGKAAKKERGAILDRLVETTGMNRDHLAAALRGRGKAASTREAKGPGKRRGKKRAEGKRGGRPRVYGPEFTRTLTLIWESYGQICGKLLVPLIRSAIDFLAESKDYGVTGEIRNLLVKVSPAEADILLRPARKAREIRGVSATRAAAPSLRSQVPIQTRFDRKTVKPGFFAFDTVARCGASSKGQFCKTLTGTDGYSGWTEERPLLNAANRWVQAAIPDIESALPFPAELNRAVERLLRINREKVYSGSGKSTEAGEAAVA